MSTEYCFVISIKANPTWLQLKRQKRDTHWDTAREIIKEYADRVSFTYYDSDAFQAHMSDMAICHATDPLEFHHMWDRLKDTALFSEGYYTISDVRFGIKGVSHG